MMDTVKRLMAPAKRLRIPKVEKGDVMAGVTTGIANVPDGMASAVLAGVNPVHGIYTLILGTPIASMTISTKLMMFNTTSAMTLVAVDGLGSRIGQSRVDALLAIALIAGIFQLALGVLGLGILTKFVPNAVMTGFLTGIGTLIILGRLWELTGYRDELGGSSLERTARLLANLREVDPWTTGIGVGTLALMAVLSRTKLANFNLLVGMAVATVVVAIFSPATVSLVSSLGEIPRALPSFGLPRFGQIPELIIAGVAVGAVGVLQAAGVSQAYPNPDGSESSDSRDFRGQGIANISNSFFGGMAGGGSLSGTALHVGAGARTRMAGVVQGFVVIVLILVFSDLLGKIPMAALSALLIYAAALSFKFRTIQTIQRTSLTSLGTMGLTFFATLVMPLQQAVMFGVVVAAIVFIYRASVDVRIQELTVVGERLHISEPSAALRPNDVTVLDVDGNLFYAGARTFGRLLPSARGVSRPVVVVRLRGQHDLGSTFFKVISGYAVQVREQGGRLLLAGVEPDVETRLHRTGLIKSIGEENVFPAGNIFGESILEAERIGRAWLDQSVEITPATGDSERAETTPGGPGEADVSQHG
jgi:SulP family sulfate permease